MVELAAERLAEIEARCEAATPGTWKSHKAREYSSVFAGGLNLCKLFNLNGANDSRFIAHARSDVPALLDEVKRLWAECDALFSDLPAKVIDLNDPAVQAQLEAWRNEPREPMTPEQIADLRNCHPTDALSMRDVWRLLHALDKAEAEVRRLQAELKEADRAITSIDKKRFDAAFESQKRQERIVELVGEVWGLREGWEEARVAMMENVSLKAEVEVLKLEVEELEDERRDRKALDKYFAGLPDWQPIDTAPKDETVLLLWSPEENHLVVGYWYKGFWRLSRTAQVAFLPSHWRPLPAPPEGTDAKTD